MSGDDLVTVAVLEKFKMELLAEIRVLLGNGQKPAKKWLKSAEVLKQLDVSPGKLHAMRVSGALLFTRIGGNIYYAQEDIDQTFEKFKVTNSVADASKEKGKW